MKLKKILKHTHAVRVLNEPLDVSLSQTNRQVSVFNSCEIAPFEAAKDSLDGVDLTACSEYRLTLRLSGESGAPFSISELYGPIGDTDQVRFTIASGYISHEGVLDFRGKFDIYGPENLFIEVKNEGGTPIIVDGVVYAIQ